MRVNNKNIIKPGKTSGMHHIALFCINLEDCVDFYSNLLDMEIEWQPDQDNYYLSSGNDNLALHRAPESLKVKLENISEYPQFLDHIGFILNHPELVDDWYDYLESRGIEMMTKPRTHRDGARSFYCKDPDGRTVQMINHPPLDGKYL